MDFDELLDVISSHSINDMINVIITDAGFGIDVPKTVKFIEKMNGLFIFITNMPMMESNYKEVESKSKGSFKYVLADRHFDLHESTDKI